MDARGWYSRGYLPHFDGGETTQFVTFSLVDCYPRHLLDQWREELRGLPENDAEMERRLRIEAYLDMGHGKPWLRDPVLADLVQQALSFRAGVRYTLHAWVVMPSHVHALFTPKASHSLARILHTWKSYTSNKANAYLRREGSFWLHESYDRYIRDERHFASVVAYIEANPVKAGLCLRAEDWPWSSAGVRGG